MTQNTTQQFETVSSWGIAKGFRRYNEHSQVIDIDPKLGSGCFEVYDFGGISVSKVNATFHSKQTMTNQHADMAYILYFILEGDYHYTVHANQAEQGSQQSNQSKEPTKTTSQAQAKTLPLRPTALQPTDSHYHVVSPSLWLVRGGTQSITASIAKQQNIKALQIMLAETLMQQLMEQFATQAKHQQSLLQHFILQDASEVHFPLTDHANAIFTQAWQVYQMPAPTDELAFMSLKGACLSFVSELLTKPYAHLFTTRDDIPSYAIQAKFLIEQFYHQNWTTRQLAQKVGTNESYLKKHFKALTKQTINKYQTSIRMQHAERLFAQGASSHEVAHQLGYANHHYFQKLWSQRLSAQNSSS